MTRFRQVLLWLIYLGILFEGGSFIFAKYFYDRAEAPTYSIPKWSGHSDYTRSYFTERSPWGVWHKNNVEVKHVSKCFDITLRTNSYGARDRERPLKSNEFRVLVLGDSFVEGFGVDQDQRLTDLLEKEIGRTVLNFGSSGDVGPLQYRILYEQFASTFDHDAIIVMILPDNDFTDNWLPYWKTMPEEEQRRYRPYYGTCGTDACPIYPSNPAQSPGAIYQPVSFEDLSFINKILLIWRHFSWSWSVYKSLSEIIAPPYSYPEDYSGYRDPTPSQVKAALSSIIRIRELAGNRPMLVALIPTPRDISALAAGNHSLLVPKAFEDAAHQYGFKFLDLAAPMLEREPNPAKWFLSCNGHWSILGNKLAAQVLADRYNILIKGIKGAEKVPDAP